MVFRVCTMVEANLRSSSRSRMSAMEWKMFSAFRSRQSCLCAARKTETNRGGVVNERGKRGHQELPRDRPLLVQAAANPGIPTGSNISEPKPQNQIFSRLCWDLGLSRFAPSSCAPKLRTPGPLPAAPGALRLLGSCGTGWWHHNPRFGGAGQGVDGTCGQQVAPAPLQPPRAEASGSWHPGEPGHKEPLQMLPKRPIKLSRGGGKWVFWPQRGAWRKKAVFLAARRSGSEPRAPGQSGAL